jgi:hypothetical protein
MKSLLLQAVSVALLVSLIACGKSTTDPSGSNGSSGSSGSSGSGGSGGSGGGTSTNCSVPGNPASGSFSATIDGVAFRATCFGISTAAAGVISFGGGIPGTATTTQTFAIATTLGVGTTNIGATSPTNALFSIGPALWTASVLGGSGSVTITSNTVNSVAGTFSLVLIPQAGTSATGNKTVTNGSFNLTF